MSQINCDGCQRGLPVHNSIHVGELEMIRCTAFESLTLEPISRGPVISETWHQPRAKKPVPFTCGDLS